MKYSKILFGIIVLLAAGSVVLFATSAKKPVTPAPELVTEMPAGDSPETPEMVVEDETGTGTPEASVKEFSMTAYYDDKGVWYSLKEMSVKKGDTVRMKVTNTKGMHDLTIDEYGIKQELPLNEEVTIEFTADKVGDFVYYCSKPNHRAKGQWGTLKVTE
jgi:heme/copper-type cytochrome/quinol oxidase subunit 2